MGDAKVMQLLQHASVGVAYWEFCKGLYVATFNYLFSF